MINNIKTALNQDVELHKIKDNEALYSFNFNESYKSNNLIICGNQEFEKSRIADDVLIQLSKSAKVVRIKSDDMHDHVNDYCNFNDDYYIYINFNSFLNKKAKTIKELINNMKLVDKVGDSKIKGFVVIFNDDEIAKHVYKGLDIPPNLIVCNKIRKRLENWIED